MTGALQNKRSEDLLEGQAPDDGRLGPGEVAQHRNDVSAVRHAGQTTEGGVC